MRSREARRLVVLGICFLIGLGSLLGSYFLIGDRKQEKQEAPPRDVAEDKQQPDKARLVVLIVVDQLRGDLLTRWDRLFGDRGFRRLAREGAWFQNCYYPYGS